MQQLIQLTGIARLAAEGSLLSGKSRVEYRSLPTRQWLNRCNSRRVPFDWTINPYRGCEYGCKYCYARFTHVFMERTEPGAFETEIYAKDWDLPVFRLELKKIKAGQTLGIGTATDPYQPIERRFESTRKVLEALDGMQGVRIFITSKSDLVARDVSLLKSLGKHNQVRVTSTITTMDRKLARATEPFAPRPDLRMGAVARLADAGVQVGVIASPVLPLITDSEESLESVAFAAKSAGADQFGANLLFLKPSAQRVFFPFVAEQYPQHLERYRRSYRSGAYLSGRYPELIKQRVENVRARVGIWKRDLDYVALPKPLKAQRALF